MGRALLLAACGTGFTFLMTALGAATVFFFAGGLTRAFDARRWALRRA